VRPIDNNGFTGKLLRSTQATGGKNNKLPLSRSVLPESRPFEVTTLRRGKEG